MPYKTGIKINKCVIEFMFLFFRRLFTGFTEKNKKNNTILVNGEYAWAGGVTCKVQGWASLERNKLNPWQEKL